MTKRHYDIARVSALIVGIGSISLLSACGGIRSDDLGAAVEDDDREQSSAASQPIIGGTEVTPGQVPWQIALLQNGSFTCGGSLIATNWVLTAKHCVAGVAASELQVILGEHNRTTSSGDEQSRSVSTIVQHPTIDIALLKLAAPATLNARVQTVALATGDDGPGLTANVSGWGWTSGGGSASNVLMQASVPIVSNADCNAAPKLSSDLNDNELCAGFLDGERGGCHGDSGGPLVVSRSGVPEQVGVVSWGQGYYCSTYTVYARVSSAIDWIRQQAPVGVRIATATNLSTTGIGNVKLKAGADGEGRTYALLWGAGRGGYRKWYKPTTNQAFVDEWPYAGGALNVGWPPSDAAMSNAIFYYDANGDGAYDMFRLVEQPAGIWSVYLTATLPNTAYKIASATNTDTTGNGNVKIDVGVDGNGKYYVLLWASGQGGYRKWYKPTTNTQVFQEWPYAGGSLGVGWPPDRAMDDAVRYLDVDNDGDLDTFQLVESSSKVWDVYLIRN